MSLLRRVIGGVLRRVRLRQGRTLREVALAAGVSLPYLSEVERGRKEASSEVLAAICRALGIHLSDLLEEARDELRRAERRAPVTSGSGLVRLERAPAGRGDVRLHVGSRPGRPQPHLSRRPRFGGTPLLGTRGTLTDLGLAAGGPIGAGTGYAVPTVPGTGTRIWLIPSPAPAHRRPRTGRPTARRRTARV
ncbi:MULTISPECIES: helix-turn-helix domain-containing protein [Micromonospora]|uniref:XRE family transcriptional regulator n=1 Tax=Micromonospora solifontis TaxID=2487138 RepID=A0ABX9WE94_9ACTN|nr:MULTISPECIES: helix-turn-helix domain-containing protein [Micromonospora]NES16572.1 helix-turn-helix domain-containing protein [Micromonospora sp. PPF5-17B]NES37602.1 helix-turn-helix domain-containing protein [Micromonospora solifontis]NES58504.1 helix-turn-helix domain-containing protein [Micromonospora sp. PPF5-6]RNL98136.1 XRE family transcriptional regulator [Micromonospora solifontis]